MPVLANDPARRLILGLDVPTVAEARALVAATRGAVGTYKIGHQLLFSGGLALAEELIAGGESVFVDAKLLDIDNTVASGVVALGRLGPDFLTIHAYPKAMRAAVAAKRKSGAGLRLLAVTVLTSMDGDDLAEAGYAGTVKGLVLTRAAQAVAAGVDGIVCAPHEVAAIRAVVGPDIALVTPGVRPAGSDHGDQKRVTTPFEAIRSGADYVVVARPIAQAADPQTAAGEIVAEIEAGLAAR
jgi:orotidine-5'-phosphate decarboxylase